MWKQTHQNPLGVFLCALLRRLGTKWDGPENEMRTTMGKRRGGAMSRKTDLEPFLPGGTKAEMEREVPVNFRSYMVD